MKRPISFALQLLILICVILHGTSAWEWPVLYRSSTLSMQEVSSMRVRDIKRRLTRQHGYTPDELARMIDKKDLIQALAFEEHKDKQVELAKANRNLRWKAIVIAIILGALLLFWPLLNHLYDVATVNLVVYSDRKIYEAKRCMELKSVQGCIGVLLMGALDMLQIWLTGSVLLSWVMTSKYFFPIPNIPIRPAALMGGPISQGSLSSYGINVGPMIITWAFRFLHSFLEGWVGRALKASMKRQRKQAREDQTFDDKVARKAVKKAKKEEERRQREEEDRQFRENFMRSQTETCTEETTAITEEKHELAAQAAEPRHRHQAARSTPLESNSAMDELD